MVSWACQLAGSPPGRLLQQALAYALLGNSGAQRPRRLFLLFGGGDFKFAQLGTFVKPDSLDQSGAHGLDGDSTYGPSLSCPQGRLGPFL